MPGYEHGPKLSQRTVLDLVAQSNREVKRQAAGCRMDGRCSSCRRDKRSHVHLVLRQGSSCRRAWCSSDSSECSRPCNAARTAATSNTCAAARPTEGSTVVEELVLGYTIAGVRAQLTAHISVPVTAVGRLGPHGAQAPNSDLNCESKTDKRTSSRLKTAVLTFGTFVSGQASRLAQHPRVLTSSRSSS